MTKLSFQPLGISFEVSSLQFDSENPDEFHHNRHKCQRVRKALNGAAKFSQVCIRYWADSMTQQEIYGQLEYMNQTFVIIQDRTNLARYEVIPLTSVSSVAVETLL